MSNRKPIIKNPENVKMDLKLSNSITPTSTTDFNLLKNVKKIFEIIFV